MRERTGDGWNEISYEEFLEQVMDYASRLLSLGLNEKQPLLILSANTINHALVSFAAMMVGIPTAPISVAYALAAKSAQKLEQIIDIIEAGAIYVADPKMFSKAVDNLTKKLDIPFISSRTGHEKVTLISDLKPVSQDIVIFSRDKITPDTIAKIMMTSGSTGIPKGVITTHRMIYSNQQSLALLWKFLEKTPPIIVDWLPWSHVFGGNVCLNIILFHGGTLNIDDGKPMPALVGRTVENLKIGKPNLHFNVPSGIESLLPHLEDDLSFAKSFFTNLKVIFVAAAALSQTARDRLEKIASKVGQEKPMLFFGWGSTETAPFSTCVYFDTKRADNLGLPLPGTQIKLTPEQDKMALSVKGPNVTTGYWRNDAATKEVFDKMGFYQMGDAGKLIDNDDPALGIIFDGRLSENFKLQTGTWVNVGKLRLNIIEAMHPFILDAVITGHNKSDIGLIVIPNYKYLEKTFNLPEEKQNAVAIASDENIISLMTEALASYNQKNRSNSRNIRRFTILPRLPEIGKNEITDKGYLNQRALLSNWKKLAEDMHNLGNQTLFFFSGHNL